MNKSYCPVGACKSGDILAVDVYNSQGALVAVKNTVINQSILNTFRNMGIEGVWILCEPDKISSANKQDAFQKFHADYINNICIVEGITKDIISGRGINLSQLDFLSDSILNDIRNCKYLLEFLDSIKDYSSYTYTHSLNVGFYSALISKWLNCPLHQIKDIIKSGLLHDLGKTKIPVALLEKKERLPLEEFECMKRHALYGYNLIKDLEELSFDIKMAVLMHHEREDGSGYPLNLKGNRLNLNTKVVSIADTYDAITSERPYKKAETPFKAFKILLAECLSTYDVYILNVFIKNLSYHYIGSKVRYNSGEVGEIVHIPLHNITKPIVRINGSLVDLSREKNLRISSFI
ncbi:MAG: HD-GYP domain-containing protein [Clostridia bacterium]|nr:HD-GYP domain-containing protein [Clostridia bacterium]